MLLAEREPVGEERADWRMAVLCSVLANINRDSKTKEYTPEQFLWHFDMERRWAEAAEPAEQGAKRIFATMQDWKGAVAVTKQEPG